MNYDHSSLNYNYQLLDQQNNIQTQSINLKNQPQTLYPNNNYQFQNQGKGFNYVEAQNMNKPYPNDFQIQSQSKNSFQIHQNDVIALDNETSFSLIAEPKEDKFVNINDKENFQNLNTNQINYPQMNYPVYNQQNPQLNNPYYMNSSNYIGFPQDVPYQLQNPYYYPQYQNNFNQNQFVNQPPYSQTMNTQIPQNQMINQNQVQFQTPTQNQVKDSKPVEFKQINCGNRSCNLLLAFTPKAKKVLCPVCKFITIINQPPVQPVQQTQNNQNNTVKTEEKQKIKCGNCRVVLSFKAGAQRISCPKCLVINLNPYLIKK